NHPFLGMNGRFDTLQAAVILAKLPHFESEVAARSRIGARYTELLSSVLSHQSSVISPPSSTPAVPPNNTHVYAQYTIRVPNRDQVAEKLKAAGIPTAVYYPKCLHEQPVFAACGNKWGDFPESERASREVLSLPMHPFLTESEQDLVVNSLKEAVG
ncbi:MAG: DegT/DnrJ/EryC1/StrS family aminotransferase, partial [Verrucomicrobia bacterium]|nr:DegT/DnrJ/EryC1/StrS family aminotransferase [Verrucomicrobiota bacterium]